MVTLNEIKAKVIQVWESDHVILPSVTAAQFILESASGTSTLAKSANNFFGIKSSAPWAGDTYKIVSNEEINGELVPKEALFRKYGSWQESVQDHSDFFVSTAFRKQRYAAVIGETDYKIVCNALAKTYATDSAYGTKLIAIIEANGLDAWDKTEEETSMNFIDFMEKNRLSYRDRRGIAPYTNGPRKMRVTNIAIHHSGANVDQTSELLENYWKSAHGWTTGGYHVIIRRNAEATIEFNYGADRISNGVGNHNGYILNICVEGNADFTPRQNEVVKLVTRFWKDALAIPYTAILGHNEFSGHATNTCPGRNMDDFRAQINAMPAADQITASLESAAKPAVSQVVRTRIPMTYDAKVTTGGYSIDSAPWGEPGFEKWGMTDDILGNSIYVYEENESGEYINAYQVGWIDKRAITREKQVVASIVHLPNGKNWTIYPVEGPYTAGDVISLEGANGESAYTVLGERDGGKVFVVELENFGPVGLYYDEDKGAFVEKKYA